MCVIHEVEVDAFKKDNFVSLQCLYCCVILEQL